MRPSNAEAFTERDFTQEDDATVQEWRVQLEQLGHLHRYMSLQGERFGWFYDVVLRSELFFPSYPELNDPFDGRVWPTVDGTDAEKRALMVDFLTQDGRPLDAAAEETIRSFLALPLDEQRQRVHAAHEAETARMGVACFAETGDDLPMWAYYGDSHRGVCLRFRGPQLLGWDGCTPAVKIDYADEYPRVSFFKDSRFKRTIALVDTKATVWAHEKEWRMVRHAGRGSVSFDPTALDGIIIGCGTSAADEARIRDVVSRRALPVELLKARPSERAFELDIGPA